MEELSSLIRRARKRPLWQPGRQTRAVQFGRRHIERILPHRDPCLLVDAITAVDLEQNAVRGSRRISPDEPVFAGHFPHRPIYPGTFQIEMMGQLGACLSHFFRCRTHEIAPDVEPTDVRALRIHHALFQGEVDLDVCAGTAAVEYPVRTVLNNAWGFGGINAVSVLRGFEGLS